MGKKLTDDCGAVKSYGISLFQHVESLLKFS